MILNEDYFKDLEITDDDIIEDDNIDVEEPEHELTLEEVQKLPEQYNHSIAIEIKNIDRDTTSLQTSLLPKLFKRFDIIFEMYGIEHSLYILASRYRAEMCDTVIKFGDYQLFCEEENKDEYINDIYNFFCIAYVNYPKFTYKRAFRFLYTVINLHRINDFIFSIDFYPYANDYVTILYFWFHLRPNEIRFQYFDVRTDEMRDEINLCDKSLPEDKIEFYKSVFLHFFKKEVRVPYKLIDRDVPLKPLKS